jgi:hypothetical protein
MTLQSQKTSHQIGDDRHSLSGFAAYHSNVVFLKSDIPAIMQTVLNSPFRMYDFQYR